MVQASRLSSNLRHNPDAITSVGYDTNVNGQPTPHRRYFDHAATSFPKPPGVVAAVQHYLENIGVSAGRGAYREAVESGRLLDDCRTAIRQLLRARPADSVIFALNGTDALNLAIKSLVGPGDHAVTTAMDHNSVLRPLSALAGRGSTWTAVEVDPHTTRLEPAAIERALRPETRLVIVNHASNVTGCVQPIAEIGEVCRRRGVLLLIDAAQTAGHLPIDFGSLPADLLAMPGHKGLLGPLGTGVLLIREGVERRMRSVREGGTGSRSELPEQPEQSPDKFEAGSHNAPGIAGLRAAMAWLLERGVESIRRHELHLMSRFVDQIADTPGLTLYGTQNPAERVGVFSLRVAGLAPDELSAILDEQFGALSRSGLHCAPLAHRTIGTAGDGGTTRLSLGVFHTDEDIDAAAAAIREIARSMNG